MNIKSAAALEDEICYSQQAKRLEPVKGINWNAANLVITQDAGRQKTGTRSRDFGWTQDDAFFFFFHNVISFSEL